MSENISGKRLIATFGLALAVGFYTAFVFENIWNWFAAAALHAPEISYWTAYGIFLGFHFIIDRDETFEKTEIFARLEMMIKACVPEERRAELDAELVAEDKQMGTKLLGPIVGQAVGNTVALGIGFVVHTLAS